MSARARAETIDRLLEAIAAMAAAKATLADREPWRDRSELDASLLALVDRALAGAIAEERRALVGLLRTLAREMGDPRARARPRDAMPVGRYRPTPPPASRA